MMPERTSCRCFQSASALTVALLVATLFSAGSALAAHEPPQPVEPGTIVASSYSARISDEGARPLTILSLDRLRLTELARWPNMLRVARMGGIGMYTTKPAGGTEPADTWLTLGSNGPAVGTTLQEGEQPPSALAFTGDESYLGNRVTDLYRQYSGAPAGEWKVMLPAGTGLVRQNLSSDEPAEPGMLGYLLALGAGRNLAVIGNADYAVKVYRPAAAMLMETSGRVEFGDVSSHTTLADDRFPGGIRSDIDAIFSIWQKTRADVTLIQFGDLERLEQQASSMYESAYVSQRGAALRRADELLGRMLDQAAKKGKPHTFMLIAPTPLDAAAEEGDYFVPLVIGKVGDEAARPGILSSPSTHRPGLVTAQDVAVAIMNASGLKVEGLAGRPVTIQPAQGVLAGLNEYDKAAVSADTTRSWALPTFVVSYALAALFLIIAMMSERRHMAGTARYLFWANLAMPLMLLLVPLLGTLDSTADRIAISIGMLAFGLLSLLPERFMMRALLGLTALTAAALMFDVMTGQYLLGRSALSYSPIAGFRYYGMGNEYMGVLVGCAVIGTAAFLTIRGDLTRRARMAVTAAVGLVVLVVLALPGAGSEFGGALAVALAFSYYVLLLSGRRLSGREWAMMAGGLVTIAVLVLALNLVVGEGGRSHIGRAAASLLSGDFQTIGGIIARKVAMNIRSSMFIFWDWLVLASLLSLGYIYGLKRENVLQPMRRFPEFAMAAKVWLLAAFACYALNDSGITAAAMVLVISFPATALCLLERNGGEGD